jgi:protein ImuA
MEQSLAIAARLAALRTGIARIGRPEKAAGSATLPFGVTAIDARLPGGGLAVGALHEVAGVGPDIEHGAAVALMVAGVLARLPGAVLWVLEQPDLFAPALDAVGLAPDRVIYAEAGRPRAVLLAMEEGLHHAGLAGVVGELSGRLTLTASRRLQLAAEQSGVTCFALRRPRSGADIFTEPIAAVTRWRVSVLPSPLPLAHAPDTPGLSCPRWHVELVRCRGGEPASWIVEAPDATGCLGLPADLVNRPAAETARPLRAAAG